jgi:hypothetical protein
MCLSRDQLLEHNFDAVLAVIVKLVGGRRRMQPCNEVSFCTQYIYIYIYIYIFICIYIYIYIYVSICVHNWCDNAPCIQVCMCTAASAHAAVMGKLEVHIGVAGLLTIRGWAADTTASETPAKKLKQ